MHGGGNFSPAVFSFFREKNERTAEKESLTRLPVHLDRIPCRNYTVYTFLKQRNGNGTRGGEARCLKLECV